MANDYSSVSDKSVSQLIFLARQYRTTPDTSATAMYGAEIVTAIVIEPMTMMSSAPAKSRRVIANYLLVSDTFGRSPNRLIFSGSAWVGSAFC